MNAIKNVQTVTLESNDGPLVAIMMGLDITDLKNAGAFVKEVAEEFKVHRMISPPETAGLCITLIGALSAKEFARRWGEISTTDQILGTFMAQMRIADVIHGTPQGRTLDSQSLLQS